MKIFNPTICDKLSNNKFGSKLSDYEVIGQLGRGATSNVYKVKLRNDKESSFALKVMDKDDIKKKNLEHRVKNEIDIHMTLNESKEKVIINLLHCFEDD